jgi:multidrug efflux pump subunit AcrA (membrane-fusion protein)
MKSRILLASLAGFALLAAGYFTRDTWQEWLSPAESKPAADASHDGHEDEPQRVVLTPQARANLRLETRTLKTETYRRTIAIPGTVIEQPGRTDRAIVAPLAGIVQRIAAAPGEVIGPGSELFTLRLSSEAVQTDQTELFKTTREIEINEDQRKRLEAFAKSGTISETRLLDLEYQQRRLTATAKTLRHHLSVHGLSPEQIQSAAEGRFVSEIVVRAPARPTETGESFRFEIEELKVQTGDAVQAGQLLATLANPTTVWIEGRAFLSEVAFLDQVARNGWPIRAELVEAAGNSWSAREHQVTIRFVGNRVDSGSQTVAVYTTLTNESREMASGGKVYRVWRFRPGQRARLIVPVEEYADVFVLPVEAVVRDGPDAFVFRVNGNAFDRRPVAIRYQDRHNVAITNDGSINAGNQVAANGAAALDRILKAKAEGGGGHDHHHHDH